MSSFTYNSTIEAHQYILDATGDYTHTYNWFTGMGCSFSTYHRSNGDVKFTFEVISAQSVAAIEEIFEDEFAGCDESFSEENPFESFDFNPEIFQDLSDRFSFNQCSSASELKSAYRQLARTSHPDLGGSTEAMQELNRAYESACLRF